MGTDCLSGESSGFHLVSTPWSRAQKLLSGSRVRWLLQHVEWLEMTSPVRDDF